MKYDVFISYSRKDSDIANQICAAFDRTGVSYFIDRQGISGGLEFPAVLADALLNSKIILYLASRNSFESKFTNAELTFAFNEKPKNSILPYIIDGSTMPPALRFVFANINWRTLDQHPIEPVLINDILRLLGRNVECHENVSDFVKTYHVGDYYDDGVRQGVVFDVDDGGQHGKIVSLVSADLEWCIEEVYCREVAIGLNDRYSGLSNQLKVMQIEGWREQYPAFAWCADQGEGWYLPAFEEIVTLLNPSVLEKVNATMESKGCDTLWLALWSSTEVDDLSALILWVDTYESYNMCKNASENVWAVSTF